MPNGQFLENDEIEACFRELHWNVMPGPRPGFWVLAFRDPEQGVAELVVVDNGQSNPGFLMAHASLVKVTRNQDCVHKAVALTNGFIDLAKVVMDSDGDVIVRAAVPRIRELFHYDMLRHVVMAVIGGVTFVRPIVQACLRGEGCDVEAVFRRRVAEVTGRG